MQNQTIGSIVIGSTNPQRLREWYWQLFSPDETADGPLQLGSVALFIEDRTDVGPTTLEPGRIIVNVHVDDITATARRLNAAGVNWLVPIENRGQASIGAFTDPDGNYVQILQLHPDRQPA